MTQPLTLSSLPLFPLNSVLFPDGVLALRVFEVRYLDMVRKCHHAGAPFGVVARLCAPVLRPFQRIIPLVGGVDLSPLAVLVLLQVAMIILGHLQAGVLQG